MAKLNTKYQKLKAPTLLVIVGPTASGKSDLALKIAQEFNGEIICADSRTVYKGMDLGTAKPTKEDRVKVKHWGLDLIEPGERFTAYQFKKYAEDAIANIQGRGKLTVLVGGTGLYIDSILFDFGFRANADLMKRKELETLEIEYLQNIIRKLGYDMPENMLNRRHLIRTIERQGKHGTKKTELDSSILVIGLMPEDSEIKTKIETRIKNNFPDLAQETKRLIDKYGKKPLLATAGIAYKIAVQFVNKEIEGETAKELVKNAEWQYARRQKTWFKRNKFIHWFDTPEQAYNFIVTTLNT